MEINKFITLTAFGIRSVAEGMQYHFKVQKLFNSVMIE